MATRKKVIVRPRWDEVGVLEGSFNLAAHTHTLTPHPHTRLHSRSPDIRRVGWRRYWICEFLPLASHLRGILCGNEEGKTRSDCGVSEHEGDEMSSPPRARILNVGKKGKADGEEDRRGSGHSFIRARCTPSCSRRRQLLPSFAGSCDFDFDFDVSVCFSVQSRLWLWCSRSGAGRRRGGNWDGDDIVHIRGRAASSDLPMLYSGNLKVARESKSRANFKRRKPSNHLSLGRKLRNCRHIWGGNKSAPYRTAAMIQFLVLELLQATTQLWAMTWK
ncbi:hypothetical protein DFH09DRAFT_1095858 [Mycena vulgaris]|nr:hypothetical protein DFH09DRAFT_1095858 [Mycena vulgaris]